MASALEEEPKKQIRPQPKVWAGAAGAGIGAGVTVGSGLAEAVTVLVSGLLGHLGWALGEEERKALTVLFTAVLAAAGSFALGYAKK